MTSINANRTSKAGSIPVRAAAILLALFLLLLLSSCSWWWRDSLHIPAPIRTGNPAPVPVPSSLSSVRVALEVDATDVPVKVLQELADPISSGSTTIQIPTNLHISLFVTEVVKEPVEKVVEKTVEVKNKVCSKTQEVCTKTRTTRRDVCTKTRKLPILGDLVCLVTKVVTESVCVATDVQCIEWRLAVVGTKIIRETLVVYEDVLKEVVKVADKVVRLDAEVDHTARVVDFDLNFSGKSFTASAAIEFKLKINARLQGVDFGALTKPPKVELNGLTSCGYDEPLARFRLQVEGQLETLPGVKFQLKKGPWKLTWERACQLTAFDIRVEDLINLPLIKDAVDNAIQKLVDRLPANFSFEEETTAAWNSLSQLHEIDRNLWLHLNLERMGIEPVTGKGLHLSTAFHIAARPGIVYGKRPTVPSKSAPNVTVETFPPGFKVQADTMLTFGELEKHLRYELIKSPPPKLKIDNLEVYGSQGKLVIGIMIKKPVRGTVYLIGTPTYVSARSVVEVADLDYTIESKAVLLKLADKLAHGKLRSLLREKAVFDASDDLEEARRNLEERVVPLTQGGAKIGTLSLAVRELDGQKVLVTPDGINVTVQFGGIADVVLKIRD